MKLIYDHEIFARQRYGGVSRYFYEIISGIAEKFQPEIDLYLGYNITGYDFSKINGNINIEKKDLSYPSKLHFIINQFNKKGFKNYFSKKKYDVFHKTYYSDVGLGLKTNIISTIHDMTHELYPVYFTKNDGTSGKKRKSVDSSKAIICVSETTKNDLVKIFNVSPEIIKVIYHGITLKNDREYKTNLKKPYLLYVGQRWGYKNFNQLLSVYAHDKALNDNYDLVCFGGGEFNYSEKLFIAKNHLESRVKQVNGNDEVLKALYSYAELFIYTSLYEGFGFPPLEAMEFGCPVLSSPGGSISEILSDSALFYDTSSGNDLLNKIQLLLNDLSLKQQYILKGKKRVKEFTWEKSIIEHYNFYNEVINS